MARISLWVKPAAKADGLAWDPWRRRWAVACRAAPTEGEANRAVARLMARWLRVPLTAVRWEKAGSSRAKVIAVDGMTDLEAADRLRRTASEARTGNPPPKA
ncbi:MAG: DUF167 domain-containing protein [Thermoplasmata archaeon]